MSIPSVFAIGMTIFLSAAQAGIVGQSQELDRDYPNELPGYQFHARAAWGSLKPLVSRDADVVAQLGPLRAEGYTFDRRWRLTVYYWGTDGYCGGIPFPASLVGTVANIELVPKARISFLGVKFPSAFEESVEIGAHDPVGMWQRYQDKYGLVYRVYDKASRDGSIRRGDLKSIVYGPSRHDYVTLTGCSMGPDE